MKGVGAALGLAALLAAGGVGAQPAPPDARQIEAAQGSAEGFVRWLYGRYAMPAEEVDGESAEFQTEAVYTPEVRALIARDSELHPDEVGFMDADWICACQDWEGVRLASVSMTPGAADQAEAAVRFTFGPERQVSQTLRLRRTPDGWRVADVIAENGESLVAGLRASNAATQGSPARFSGGRQSGARGKRA